MFAQLRIPNFCSKLWHDSNVIRLMRIRESSMGPTNEKSKPLTLKDMYKIDVVNIKILR